MTQKTPRDIPAAVARAVRQRCGYGCVICGLPIYEYHHMLGFDDTKPHNADEITMLCGDHHTEVTNGLLPKEDVAAANAQPCNIQRGSSSPHAMRYSGTVCEAKIATNVFTTDIAPPGAFMAAIVIDGVSLVGFRFEDGHYLLNALLFDEFNFLVLQIVDNVLQYRVDLWDISFEGSTLTLRQASRQILMELHFDPPSSIKIERGRFLRNGVEILVKPNMLQITNNNVTLAGSTSENYSVGLQVGPSDGRAAIGVSHVPRYVSDRAAARRWAEEAFATKS